VARRYDGCVPSLLLHPLPLAAIALTAVNDHLLKGAGVLPGWLTGKLSDFAGLFFFPIAVVAAWRAVTRGRWPRVDAAMPAIAAAITGAFMALFKLSPWVCARLPVSIVADPSDLLALPMLPLACWWIAARQRQRQPRATRWARLAALGAAALTSGATSPMPVTHYYRPLPIWSVVPPAPGAVACARPDLWVSRSGREGVGLTLAFRAQQEACTLRLARVAFVLPGAGTFVAAGFPEELTVPAGNAVHRYVPIAFDNDAAWRRKLVQASVEVHVIDKAGAQALRFDLEQRQPGAPEWGIFEARPGVNGGGTTPELLVTETAPDGVHFVIRLPPAKSLEDGKWRIGPLLLTDKKGELFKTVPASVVFEQPWREPIAVPFFLPMDASRRATIIGRLDATLELEDPDSGEHRHDVAYWTVETRKRGEP
jgi:hypothetical protein